MTTKQDAQLAHLVAKTSEVGDMGKPTRTRMGFTNPPSAHVTVTYTAVTR